MTNQISNQRLVELEGKDYQIKVRLSNQDYDPIPVNEHKIIFEEEM